MGMIIEYKCDLCDEEIARTRAGIAIKKSDKNFRSIEESPSWRDARNHVCRKCLDDLASIQASKRNEMD